ncbi:MAG: dihydroneopterin aldolase family protein [Thermoplasmata archaeon]
MEDPAAGYFDCTDAERAAFEAGIKLGSIYHQFVGAPIAPRNVEVLARSIEEGTRLQPFVEEVRVRINLPPGGADGAFSYRSLTGEMLEVDLRVGYREARVIAALRYEEKLGYPLMRIREMRRKTASGEAPD